MGCEHQLHASQLELHAYGLLTRCSGQGREQLWLLLDCPSPGQDPAQAMAAAKGPLRTQQAQEGRHYAGRA